MMQYSIEPKTRTFDKGYGFLSFTRKYKKHLLNTGLHAVKYPSKKLIHKAGQFLENKTADAVNKSNNDKIVIRELFEEIIIPLGKTEQILNELKKIIIKMEH